MMLLYYYFYVHMDQNKTIDKKTILYIAILLITAAFTRFWHLDYQSLWLDEMHTMLFADPTISWKDYWSIIGADVHPPLHYTLLKVIFSTIGYNSLLARIPSAIAGILSVWAIFLLGREILNNKLGLIAALITTVNYYNIYFSQEARNYMLAFLFVTLSFLFFIRLLKTLKLSHSIYYGLYTLLLLYCHYYAVFVIFSQIIIGLLFFLAEQKEQRSIFIKRFLLSAGIVVAGFSPWIPFLTSVTEVKSSWIPLAPDNFMFEYFHEYFGYANLLMPILFIALVAYILSVYNNKSSFKNVKKDPLTLSFLVFTLWIIISYLLPYLRSLAAVPMLYGRYTMIVLPALIIAIAYGLLLIKNSAARIITVIVFVLLSVVDIGMVKAYYTRVSKSQFREMVGYVCANNPDNLPIIDEVSYIQQQYYFKKNGAAPNIIPGSKNDLVDSILTPGTSLYNTKAFWIIGGHHDNQLSDDKRHLLETNYVRVSNAEYYDAWAELYLSKSDTGLGITYILPQDFDSGNGTYGPGADVVALWGGNIKFKPKAMPEGKYRAIVCARGTIAKDAYPTLDILLNGQKMARMYTTPGRTIATFDWNNTTGSNAIFSITHTNDDAWPAKNEDRNAFIYYIMLKRLN